MIYRRKMYKVAPRIVEEFNEHFNQTDQDFLESTVASEKTIRSTKG
jgi:hypothetical protein